MSDIADFVKSVAVVTDKEEIEKDKKRQEELAVAISYAMSGTLKTLTPDDKKKYYEGLCRVNELNPASKPFDILVFGGKEIPYCNKDGAAQLRRVHGISIRISSREKQGDVYVVTAQAVNRFGRMDESIGCVTIGNLKGEALANAIMKAETKAKRRVTLSLAGLGFLDESETDFPGAKVYDFDLNTGEIKSLRESLLEPVQAAPKSEPVHVRSELIDMAQLLEDLCAEKNKDKALETIGMLSIEDRHAMKTILAKQTLAWLKSISQPVIKKEDYARV